MAQLDDPASAQLPARLQAAVAWADALLAGGSVGVEPALEELRRHFDPAEVVELTVAMGTFIGYSKQIIVLGLEPPDMPLTVIDTPGAT